MAAADTHVQKWPVAFCFRDVSEDGCTMLVLNDSFIAVGSIALTRCSDSAVFEVDERRADADLPFDTVKAHFDHPFVRVKFLHAGVAVDCATVCTYFENVATCFVADEQHFDYLKSPTVVQPLPAHNMTMLTSARSFKIDDPLWRRSVACDIASQLFLDASHAHVSSFTLARNWDCEHSRVYLQLFAQVAAGERVFVDVVATAVPSLRLLP